MMTDAYRFVLATIVCLALPALASAQTPSKSDPFATWAAEEKLTGRQKADVDLAVSARVKELTQASTAEDRQKIEDAFIETTKLPGATKAFLETYVEKCAGQLAQLLNDNSRDTAFSAVVVLRRLNRVETLGALGAALASQHSDVRYAGVRGLNLLRRKLKDEHFQPMLSALGAAGGSETEPLVLRELYGLLQAVCENQKHAADAAKTLVSIFEGRAKLMEEEGYDMSPDASIYPSAKAVYSEAGPIEKSKLLKLMLGFLKTAVDRYYNANTSESAQKRLEPIIKASEETLSGMIGLAKGTVPKTTIASKLKAKGGEKEARQVLESLTGTVGKIAG